MIDIHTHLLFDIDDGSKSLEISLDQIGIMERAGVTDIFLTPHYIRNSFPTNKQTIQERYVVLVDELKKNDINVNLHKAAEVYLEDDIHNDIEAENLTVNDTDYVLVETSMNGFPENLYDNLFHLVRKGYKPIMAHPERYLDVNTDIDYAENLLHRNVYLQVNAGSFLGTYGDRAEKAAWQLLENGWVHFIASDNHCLSQDFILPEALKLVSKKIGEEAVELFTVTNQQKVLNNESIEFFQFKQDNIDQKKIPFFQRFIDRILR